MLYSCFDASYGRYNYFEDARRLPINADLPVPDLPPDAGRIGAAAIECGRPLPPDAKPVGSGWHARGQIVQCGLSPRGSLGASDGKPSLWFWFVLTGAVVAVLWHEQGKRRVRSR